ncbi:MAG: hypothetical protein D6773_19970 [Alphaproteobacteria bacterium]|nr:MAG: hypothetical protein D6773_19970 [Alphaproteobacteria bacterium]
MAQVATIAGLALSAIGTVQSFAAARSQAKAQRQAAEFNAAVARRNAEVARSAARQDAAAQRRETIRRLGSIRASAAASGLGREGSVIDILEESAANAELDHQTILHKGELRAIGLLDSANLFEAEGRNAERTGNQTATATLLAGTVDTVGQASDIFF